MGCGGPPELRPTPTRRPPGVRLVHGWRPPWCARLHTGTNTLPPPPYHHTQTPSTQAHTHATPAPMQHTDPPHSTPITPKRVVARASHPHAHAHTHTRTQPHNHTAQRHINTQKLWSAPLSLSLCVVHFQPSPHLFRSPCVCFEFDAICGPIFLALSQSHTMTIVTLIRLLSIFRIISHTLARLRTTPHHSTHTPEA